MPEGSYDPARTLLVTVAQVRSLTGYTSTTDASDADVQDLIRWAQAHVVGRVGPLRHNVELRGPRDASNLKYRLPRDLEGLVIVDDNLSGATNASDVLVQLRTDPANAEEAPTYATAVVSSVDALNGIVTLSAAPASTVDVVLLAARLAARRIDQEELKAAILYLTAHQLDKRVREPGKLNLANPAAGRKEPESSPPGRGYLTLHNRAMRSLMGVKPRSASVDTRLVARAEAIPTDP